MKYCSETFTNAELLRYERSLHRFLGRNSQVKRDFIREEYGLDVDIQPSNLSELNFAWACLLELKQDFACTRTLSGAVVKRDPIEYVCHETGERFHASFFVERWRDAFLRRGIPYKKLITGRIRHIVYLANAQDARKCTIRNIDDKIAAYLEFTVQQNGKLSSALQKKLDEISYRERIRKHREKAKHREDVVKTS